MDLLSVAGHKVYAPKGIGALYLREGTKIESFVHGAGHEAGRRAGTENVLLAVALGAACDAARKGVGMPQVKILRDRFWDGLKGIFGERVTLNGHPTERLAQHAQRQLCRQGRCGGPRRSFRGRRVDRLGVPRRFGDAFSRPGRHGGSSVRGDGSGPVQPRTVDRLGRVGRGAWSTEIIRVGLFLSRSGGRMVSGNRQGNGQKGHWDKTYSGDPTFFGDGASEFARTALNRFKGAAVRSVLELGCGQGRDTLLFAKEGFHATALDYSGAGLRKLRESATDLGVSDRIDTRSFDVRKPLPFPDGSFDACYSHMLLCMELSTAELRFLLGEVRRVLKTGGLELYSVRNTFDPHHGAGIHKSEEMYDIGGFVVHFFSEEKVRSLATGYELLELRRMQEGTLPRELFGVVLRKREEAADASHIQKEEEGDVAGSPSGKSAPEASPVADPAAAKPRFT